ncbi:putative metallopeptidase [Magnetospira sp. QH-2]|nr:putative metallopeptidase [Magnetospira sp. QH-2]
MVTDAGPNMMSRRTAITPSKPLAKPAVAATRMHHEKVGSGDTLAAILSRAALSVGERPRVIRALSKAYNVRRIKPGQEFTLTFGAVKEDGQRDLTKLVLKVDHRNEVHLKATDKGYEAKKVEKTLARELARGNGTINGSLYVAAKRAGVPAAAIAEMIRIYSWDLDFQRDIRRGDKFDLVYEKLIDEDGETVGTGNILVASMTLSGDTRTLYRHELKDGRIDYFDEKGQGARKALMRTPINGARLSSGFGRRKHPVLGYSKMHKGIDFAAATGTPIFAAGDGVIVKRQRKGGYGKYIRIRHNGTYHTAYAHMSRYAKKLSVGSRVRQGQVIGYVGSTGRSTGPHLHFEILKGDRQVNPLRVRMPSGEKLKGKEFARFKGTRKDLDRKWASIAPANQVAQAD